VWGQELASRQARRDSAEFGRAQIATAIGMLLDQEQVVKAGRKGLARVGVTMKMERVYTGRPGAKVPV